jgi:hypothetical protein
MSTHSYRALDGEAKANFTMSEPRGGEARP